MKILQYLFFILCVSLLAIPICRSNKGTAPKKVPVKRKVILLGVDGLTESIVAGLIKQNKLKNIQYMREHGSYGRIDSIFPTISPALWTTMATGKGRMDHGIIDFQIKDDEGRMIVANSSHRKTKALWNILSERQMKVGSIGYFTTWPVEEVNGFMISDASYFPIKDGYYPPQTKQTMQEVLGKYISYDIDRLDQYAQLGFLEQSKYFTPQMFKLLDRMGSELINNYPELKNNNSQSKIDSVAYNEFFKKINLAEHVIWWSYFVDHIRFEYAQKLYNNDLDFFTLFLKGPDIVSHLSWRYYQPDPGTSPADIKAFKDIIPNYYIFIDRVLGFFLKAADRNTTVILVSDHGFEKKPMLSFDINKILNTMGYLDYGPLNKAEKDKIFDDRPPWERHIPFRKLSADLNNIFPMLDPSQYEPKIKQVLRELAGIKVWGLSFFEEINYFPVHPTNKTDAATGVYTIDLFMNRAFFQPGYQNEQLMEGTILINRQPYPVKNYFTYEALGTHATLDGVIEFIGPDIKSNGLIQDFSILDITPAILKILELPVGKDMAGKVPAGIFKPDFFFRHPTRYIESYDKINRPLPKTTPAESPVEHKTKKQLRALGYIQ